MPTATLHDGHTLDVLIEGSGPTLLMPVNPIPVEGEQADVLRRYGADPRLGRSLIDGLRDVARVVAFDYEGHVLTQPKPETLTPDNVVADMLAVADAAGADRFAWYGYSWLAMIGLQLAIRTDRLTGLAMGGYPPIDGLYEEMRRVTRASHDRATGAIPIDPDGDEWSSESLSVDQTRQFVTLYEALRDFDDRAVVGQVAVPRLCFGGSADQIEYGKGWGDVRVDIAGPIVRNRAELERFGWRVIVLDGLDHMAAMQANRVVPILRDWLAAVSLVRS
jgi:pimeloyl-ACP methyl ester carboxylesterase